MGLAMAMALAAAMGWAALAATVMASASCMAMASASRTGPDPDTMNSHKRYKRMRTSDTIGELAGALAAVQGVLIGASPDSKNPHLRSTYASLTACWAACRAPLAANGLAVVQGLTVADGVLTCSTRLCHSSGEWIESSLTLPVQGSKGLTIVQSTGSVATYARRYGLCSLVGIAPKGEDNDGHARPVNHASFAAHRTAFFAALKDLDWDYDKEVAPWCEARGWGRPSGWTTEKRKGLLEALKGGARADDLLSYVEGTR